MKLAFSRAGPSPFDTMEFSEDHSMLGAISAA